MKTPTAEDLRPPPTAASTEVYVELLRLHARALRRMPWVQAFVVLGVIVWVGPAVPIWEFLAWGFFTIGIKIVRSFYASRLLHQGDDFEPKRAHRQFVALAALAGFSIGGGLTEEWRRRKSLSTRS